MASGDEYWATLNDGITGGVYALPGVIPSRAPGVPSTIAAPCNPELVETRTVDTRLFVCLSAVREQ